MEYILSSLEMFAGVAENLIDYTFNVSSLARLVCVNCWCHSRFLKKLASYEMNEVMYVDVFFIRKHAHKVPSGVDWLSPQSSSSPLRSYLVTL